MLNKASEVSGASQTKFKRADLSNLKVQMLDKNNAIVTYEISSDVTTPDGKDVSDNRRDTSVYTKRGGKWLVTHHTDFKIEK
jgi:ketosteroid isomerase-like protein